MIQLLLYILFLLIGAIATFFIFRIRLKKISGELMVKIDKFRSSFPAGSNPKVALETGSQGIFNELISAGNKLESIREIKSAPAPVVEAPQKDNKSDDLKKRLENLQVVNELGQRVTASLKLEETFQHLYKTINSLMDAAVVELGIYYRRENRWKILSNIDINNDDANEETRYKNHMAEWCLQNKREIFLDDAENEFSRYVFKPLILSDGRMAQSIMSFPILRQDNECGSLTIISFRKKAFNDYHVEMLRSLLPYTAVAMENSLVHQELIVTQDQLIHNEKMASIGQLASGIAHEILNPLNFVNNFSILSKELLGEIQPSLSLEEQSELKVQLVSNLDKISFHGSRAYDIVKSMMMLSRTGKEEKTSVDVNKSIEDFLIIAFQGFKNKIIDFECRVEKSFDEKLPYLEIISQDFGRVLLNLFSNAFYAMNEKRKKLNSNPNSSSLIAYEPELIIKTSQVNSMIIITVRDNGTGIPDEIKEKIFLPFFTTKPTGEGTGLGLSLSYDSITKGNRGQLTVKSEFGKWSEFRIELPVAN